MNCIKSLYGLCRVLPNLTLQNVVSRGLFNSLNCKLSIREFKTSPAQYDLMEFFDDKKYWSEPEVKLGRAWKLEELRLKSNTDLHKLWYVLLKERNMLFTMEHECNVNIRQFPNPERIDKVKLSMENLEKVVRERNIAYYQLETGDTGERPVKEISTILGTTEDYKLSEHSIPKFMNTKFKDPHVLSHNLSFAARKFVRASREQTFLEKRREQNRKNQHVLRLLVRFPKMDMQKLQQEFPDVDIVKIKNNKKCRGHFVPENE